eukprot:ctg_1228.g249
MESLRAAREREAALAQAAHDCALALAGLRAELAQELSAALTASEAQALRDAQHRIETLSGELEAAAAERAAVELRLAAVEGELESNWERRVREIDRRIAATNAPTEPSDPSAAATADLLLPSAPDEGASLAARTERLEALRLELEACTANVEALQASCARLAAAVSRAQARCRQLTDEETELRAREASLASQRQHMSKRLDTLLTRRSVLQQQKADAERKIRDLGALSTDTAIESLPEQPSPPQLRRRLRQLHQQLGRYAHVNKKALEQYTSFVEQRQALREREQELARGDVSIRELIDTLDRRRTQDLNRTFKRYRGCSARCLPSCIGAGALSRSVTSLHAARTERRPAVDRGAGAGAGHSAAGSGAVPPVRRGGRQPRRCLPRASGRGAASSRRAARRAVYRHHVPAGDDPARAAMFRRAQPEQAVHAAGHHRRRGVAIRHSAASGRRLAECARHSGALVGLASGPSVAAPTALHHHHHLGVFRQSGRRRR